MKPSSIPDVLFLRPNASSATQDVGVESEAQLGTENFVRRNATEVASSEPKTKTAKRGLDPTTCSNDVVFSTAVAEPSTVPTPHTRFAGRTNDNRNSDLSTDQNPITTSSKPANSIQSSAWKPTATKSHHFQLEVEADNQLKTEVEPSWMVDRFQWSPITDQLIETNSEDLARLVREIQSPDQKLTVIGIFGLGEQVGTTTVSQLFVRLLDEHQQSRNRLAFDQPTQPSLLLDADLWNPSIGSQIGLRCRRCWADLQEQRDTLGDAAISNGQNRIHVMPLNCSLQEDEFDARKSRPTKPETGYSIPAAGMSGLVSRLKNVIAHGSQCYSNIVIDFGTVEAWQSRSGLRTVGSLLTNILLVNRPPIDRRQFSQVYWEFADANTKNIHVLENPLVIS